MATMETRFTRAFALRHPIVCAPMALVTGGVLAAAVSRAGGLGMIGGGYAATLGQEPDLGEQLRLAQPERVGVGFITWALDQAPQLLDVALAARPACLFLSFGNPRPHAERARAQGVPVFCQVQCLRHIDEALDAGAAVIVAQGTEAGGHGAARATLPFVPEAADHLARRSPDTLLLAAGGIADGRGLAAALMLGADGVVVGTRFWASAEALTAPAAVERGINASGDDTVRMRALDLLRGTPWPEEFSFRVVRNRLTDEWVGRDQEAARQRGALAADYAAARARNDFDIVAVVGGEAVGLIHDRPPAARIIETMIADAALRLQQAPRFIRGSCENR